MSVLAAGTPVPEFTLKRADGSDFTKADLAGRTTVFVFFPFAFSSVCTDQFQIYEEVLDEFVAAGAADVIHVKTPDLGGINNTIEALLLVRAAGLAAFCGGTCNETDHSAQVSAQVAMACGAAQVLAKPGMGVDEGMMIVGNEMARTAALVARRDRGPQ